MDWRSCLHKRQPWFTGAFFYVGTAVFLGSALIHHGGWRDSAADSNAARGTGCTLDGVHTTAKATDCTSEIDLEDSNNNSTKSWQVTGWSDFLGEEALETLADMTLSKFPSLGQGHWKSRWCLGVRVGGCTQRLSKVVIVNGFPVDNMDLHKSTSITVL